MNALLEEATIASRAGKKAEAYALLAQLLKTDPQNVSAWYLLSANVDNPDQQRTFLEKVLALDPYHVEARQQLAELNSSPPDGAAAPPSTTAERADETTSFSEDFPPPAGDEPAGDEALLADDDLLDFLEQAESDALPAWLSAEEPDLAVELPPVSPFDDEAEGEAESGEPLPDWLQQEAGLAWFEESAPEPAAMPAAEVVEPAAAVALPRTRPAADRMNVLLTALIVTTVIVTLVLWYFIFITFT